MGTYFHGNQEIQQQDGLQTLYLMNPGFIGFSDAPPPPASANMAFLNSTATLLNPMSFSHNQQPIIGVPLHSHDANRPLSSVIRPSVNLSSSCQGLSLSLSPQRNQFGLHPPPPHAENLTLAEISPALVPSNGAIGGAHSVLMGSKYLKAAQQLLDEVAHVGEGLKAKATKGVVDSLNPAKTSIDGEHGDGSKRGDELTTAERLEIQKKKAKLVSMLDEVEQRYKQYNHQMQMVVSSFEAAAGFGSARAYTALALQTISKQFRCLRDAFADQIRATSRSLGEDDRFVGSGSQSSRLRFVDHHLRQQRALQQLGMIQHNAWRPQRGLPEKAVSVLRAWLFEHFLHPYPKDSDKHMLARQTGLTRSQVSNWFINARVRLWKPMVEEMYLEETKAKEEQNNIGEKTSISNGVNEEEPMSKSNTRLAHAGSMRTPSIEDEEGAKNQPNHDRYENGEDLIQSKMKKARIDLESLDHNQEILMSFGDARVGADGHNGYSFLASSANHGGGFEAYSFDHQQFSTTPRLSGNSVSLTLGLPYCEGLSLSGEPPVYHSSERIPMARRLEGGEYCSLNNISPPARSSNVYEDISIHSRKRFAAHMLQDFVA